VHFVEKLHALGINKFITTPHIHGEMYDNDTQKVQRHFQPLKDYLAQHLPQVSIQVSAEYFLDTYFLSDVLPKGLMAFGKNNVLVEVSMAGWNRQFNEIMFAVQANGYNPILAHPERYAYYHNDYKQYHHLADLGFLLQVNILSLTGYYGKAVTKAAAYIIKNNLASFIGTDLHHLRHVEALQLPANRAIFAQAFNEKLNGDMIF